jgi:ERF superfamily
LRRLEMNRSDSIANLAKALALAQPYITNPPLDAVNPHFRSRYATLAAHIDSVRLPLATQGISVVQSTRIDVPGMVVVVTSLMHSSGEWISSEIALPSGATPQTYGSALTYARRYALAALVGIVGDEDDDANAATPQAKATAKPEKAAAKPKPEEYSTRPQGSALPEGYERFKVQSCEMLSGKDSGKSYWKASLLDELGGTHSAVTFSKTIGMRLLDSAGQWITAQTKSKTAKNGQTYTDIIDVI